MEISKLLGIHFCDKYSIPHDAEYTAETIDARELLVVERIDLAAKLIYIKARETGVDIKKAREIYRAHIEAFSDGLYIEYGQEETKKRIADFFRVFDGLIDCVRQNGFDANVSAVPVGFGNVILDGAHRTAVAAYFGAPLTIIRLEHIQIDFGPEFFRQKHLSPRLLNHLLVNYTEPAGIPLFRDTAATRLAAFCKRIARNKWFRMKRRIKRLLRTGQDALNYVKQKIRLIRK